MNPFVPELAPLMLAAPSAWTATGIACVAIACAAGVVAAGWRTSRAYAALCSGVALWVIARIHVIPLDVFMVGVLPQFALPPARDLEETAVHAVGLIQYLAWSQPAPPAPEVNVAWVAVFAFLCVATAGSWQAALVRAGAAALWLAYPRAAHAASGAMLVSAVALVSPALLKPVQPMLAVLGAALAVSLLGEYVHLALALAAGGCLAFEL
jgi:hypothetical protein